MLHEWCKILYGPSLFWLDAHWETEFPLPDELRVISKWGRSAIIIIDDFKHPTRPLGCDSYNGQAIDVDLVKTFLPKARVFVPDYNAPRGYAVVFQQLDADGILLKHLERIW